MDVMGLLNFLMEVEVDSLSDERGILDVAELHLSNKFICKRIYYISNVPEVKQRGSHAHKELQQIFFAISGSFRIRVTDGLKADEVQVQAHSRGYYLPSGLWRDLDNFTPDAVCLVLASEHYEESDYLNSIEDYLGWRSSIAKS
jgi:hypothetical protein